MYMLSSCIYMGDFSTCAVGEKAFYFEGFQGKGHTHAETQLLLPRTQILLQYMTCASVIRRLSSPVTKKIPVMSADF